MDHWRRLAPGSKDVPGWSGSVIWLRDLTREVRTELVFSKNLVSTTMWSLILVFNTGSVSS